ncbi:hypothetical protein AB0H73_38775 [Streptomyces olivoreticuli]|uniref:hypothetical protein n=1 Tax=Streptomyces olivoreticuli TaxID=68246 RepID=UPI000E2806F0|nr:hypothetical protein [Streptomyces olivoreticuli]
MITASNPWQGHDFAAMLAVLAAGAATLLSLAGYLCSRLTREARREYTTFRLCRDLSLLTAAAALAVYLWGCLHSLFLADQELAHRCEQQKPAGTPALVGLRGDFIPLRVVCETSNGHDYSIAIPGYINPTVALLLLLALTCALTSAILHYKQRTTTRKKG